MPGPRGLVQHLDQGLHREELLPRGARLLVAVSGGADSVALLRLLVEINRSAYWGWTLVVGHVDHGIRGKASRADARFVAKLAKDVGLPFVEKRLTLKPRAKGGFSEDAARQGRLQALRAMVRAKKCTGVVMAHHADDQAETVLMRMFRGCGLDGLAGMAAQSHATGNLRLFRPLLETRRLALRDYLAVIGQSWREDASNASDQYLRNRVRRNLMPLLEVLWPRAVEALGRLAILAAEAQAVVAAQAAAVLGQASVVRKKSSIAITRNALRNAPPAIASEILRTLVATLGGTPEIADFERIREAVRIAQSTLGGKRIEMGAGLAVLLPTTDSKDAGTVQIVRAPTHKRPLP